MILYEDEYREYIIHQGIGANNRVGSSPNSHISYLNRVSRLIGQDISPALIRNRESINNIITQLNELNLPKSTLSNCKTALNHYLRFSEGG